jgi:streptogramin lyase
MPARITRIVVAATSALVLAACGGGADEPADPTSAATSGGETTEAPTTEPATSGEQVWVATETGVGTIDPATGEFEELADAGFDVSGIAAGDGHVWVQSYNDGVIAPFDPETGSFGESIAMPWVGGNPDTIAYGFGSVWQSQGDEHVVARLDPATGEVQAEIATDWIAGPIAVSPEAVWVLNDSSATVTRIDPTTNEAQHFTVPDGSTDVKDIAAGDSGVWVMYGVPFASETYVAPIDPVTGAFGTPITVRGPYPAALTVAGGKLWVLDQETGTVTGIDVASGEVSAPPVETGGEYAYDAAVTADAVWVLEFYSGSVVQIDPESGEQVATIEVGNQPAGITATTAAP